MTSLVLNSEKVTLVRILKTKNIPNAYKIMHKNLRGIEARRASIPVKCKIPIHSLLKFLLLKTMPEPQFSVIARSPNLYYLLTLTCSLELTAC